MNISGVNQFSTRYSGEDKLTNRAPYQTPAWNRIPYKGMETLPPEELMKQIEDLGKQMAYATTHKEFQSFSKRIHELEAQFLSPVSPDRKALFEEGTDIVNSLLQSGSEGQKGKKDGPLLLSFFEYMDIYKGKRPYKNEKGDITWPLSGGGTMTAMELSPSGVAFAYRVGNEVVMSNLSGEWTYTSTKAELARSSQFYETLYNAKNIEKQNSTTQPPQAGKVEGRFSVTA